MCTVSWLPDPTGYSLWFNRDESRTRHPGLRAEERRVGAVRYLAPLDGDQGGTWIAVNQYGLTLGLLNRYHPSRRAAPVDPLTRGRVVVDLIGTGSMAEAADRLADRQLERFRPFTLVAVEPGSPVLLAAWDGRDLEIRRHSAPGFVITSSAFEQDRVAGTRAATFASALHDGTTATRLTELHRSHLPQRGAFSICMHRPDAETRSLTLVEVDSSAIRLAETMDAPCRSPLGTPHHLARQPLPCPTGS